MRKIPVLLVLVLVLATAALTPGKVVFQNDYPKKGMEADYDLKDTFVYGEDTDINGRCYYADGKTLGQLIEEILALNPDSAFKSMTHTLTIYFDPASGHDYASKSWTTGVTPPENMDWNQAGCYFILPMQEDAWGQTDWAEELVADLNGFGEMGVRGTHKVVYSVVLEFYHQWNSYWRVWDTWFTVVISEGSFNWVVP